MCKEVGCFSSFLSSGFRGLEQAAGWLHTRTQTRIFWIFCAFCFCDREQSIARIIIMASTPSFSRASAAAEACINTIIMASTLQIFWAPVWNPPLFTMFLIAFSTVVWEHSCNSTLILVSFLLPALTPTSTQCISHRLCNN